MPSYVIVWENNTFGHRAVSGRTWAGHSSMNIGQVFQRHEAAAEEYTYVSYWPGTIGTDFRVKSVIRSKTQKAQAKWAFSSDMLVEKWLPDWFIEMPSGEGRELAMKAEWKAILLQADGPRYRNLRENCSTIVSRVLHAGGFYAKKWAVDSNFAWSPSDIARLATSKNAGGRALTWPEALEVLQASGINPATLGNQENLARSGCYSQTGAGVKYQTDKRPRKGPQSV